MPLLLSSDIVSPKAFVQYENSAASQWKNRYVGTPNAADPWIFSQLKAQDPENQKNQGKTKKKKWSN